MEIAAGIMAFRYNNQLNNTFESFLEKTIRKYYKGAELENGEIDVIKEVGKPVSEAWDFTQFTFECCGATNYSDFHTLPAEQWEGYYNYTVDGTQYEIFNASVPISCCKVDKKKSNYPKKIEFEGLTECLTTADGAFTNHDGCYGPLKKLYQKYTRILAGVAIGVAIIEITGIIAAFCLVKAINKDAGEATV